MLKRIEPVDDERLDQDPISEDRIMGWGKRKSRTKGKAAETIPEIDIDPMTEVDGEEEAAAAEAAREDDWSPESAMPEELSTIGHGMRITGELTGDEDVVIDGTVEGTISLSQNCVTIGPAGRVQAEIRAQSVRVEGRVVGNITAHGRVEITPTGSILGDIRAGRVVLAEGARFKGSIDMGPDVEIEKEPAWGFQSESQDEPVAATTESRDEALSGFDFAGDEPPF